MFLETLNTSLGEEEINQWETKCKDPFLRNTCNIHKAEGLPGGLRGRSTAMGAGMPEFYPSSPALLWHEGRESTFHFHMSVSSAARDGKDAHCHPELKHPHVAAMYY